MATALTCAKSPAGNPEDPKVGAVETNLSHLGKRFEQMTHAVVRRTPLRSGDSIGVNMVAASEPWIVNGAVSSALKADSFIVFTSSDSNLSTRFTIAGANMRIQYKDMHRNGMFGTQKVRREIFGEMSVTVTRGSSNEIVYSGTVSDTFADSVEVDAIPAIESSDIAVTQATLPPENGLDRFVEPFVIIGATAVALYLLFHVRS